MTQEPPKTIPIDVKNNYLYRGFDEFPFYYFDNEQPTMSWMCNYDHNHKITSVVENLQNHEKITRYFDTLDDAKSARNQLIVQGWVEGQLPQVEMNQENWDALPRQQRRRIQRQLMRQAIKMGKEDKRKAEIEKKRYEERKRIRELKKGN